jgi:L-iditol 2-dehydrogenase
MPTLTDECNLGAVLHGIGDLRVEEIPMPEPSQDEVLISMRSVGICGSDAHYLDHGRIGDFVCKGPMVLGHEASGVVAALGSNVTTLRVGDRVAIEPGVPCATCDTCRSGRYNLCPDVRFAATPPVHGSLAQFIAHPAAFCYRLPDSMPFDHAALLEPLSVGIHACRRAHVALGHTVLITGAGTVGLVSMVAARAAGAHRIVVTDVDEARLTVAKTFGKHGADETILINSYTDPKVLGATIAADSCIECSGAEDGVRLCIYGAKRGGTVVLVGMGKPEMSVPILDAACREVDVRGIFRYCNTYPAALALASCVDLSQLITHRFPLKHAQRAFDTFKSRECNSIKVIIDCSTVG